MKKVLFSFLIAFMAIFNSNAQVATENSKLFDNTYVGVEVGATTPLNFNSVFPLNTVAGIKFGKELTPVFGLEVEGFAVFNDNVYRYGYESSTPVWDENAINLHENGSINTFVKGANVGLNGVINWSNFLFGYQGTPRAFEVKTNTGIGFIHYFGEYTPNNPIGGYKLGGKKNELTAKTAIDLAFNFGSKKANTLTVSPGIYWGLNEEENIRFNKSYAQFGVMVGYTYHFKTSNGTHAFKTYDVGAMIDEINRLNEELAKKPTEVEVIKYVDRVVNNYNAPVTNVESKQADVYVFFAFDSDELSDNAKAELDKIGQNGIYCIDGYSSAGGNDTYNLKLSQRRADAVKAYLEERGCRIESATGHGVEFGETTGRVVIVSAK
jgi:outer membrane protein OmpA-like peptidoglycan-associated protein